MPETHLVTGAAGFIGSHLVDALLARGDAVVGVDNFDPFYDPTAKRKNLAKALAADRFRLIELDCRDLAALEREMRGETLNSIVHLAAKAGVRPSIQSPTVYADVNVVGTQAMLELARRLEVTRFVFGSSSSVYGNSAAPPFREDDVGDHPISPYAATKRAGELLCFSFHHLFAMHVIALRFFTVYGPRQRPDLAIRKFATLMRRGEAIPLYGDGTTSRDYTWIGDIVTGILAALERTGTSPAAFEAINLGGSQTTQLAALVDEIGLAMGIKPTVDWLPSQPGDVRMTCADVNKAKNLLGYVPRMPLPDGLRLFLEWLAEAEPGS